MDLITETYFGWDPLTHTTDCPSPVWDTAEIRRTEGVRPRPTGAHEHACPTEHCCHGDAFGRVQLRLLCRDCGTVYTISGESLTEVCTHTSLTGWGQTPTQYGDAVTPATLYGIVTAYRDASGTRRWIAGAEPDDDGAHQISTLRWRHSSNALDSVAAAAAWIADAETRTHRPLVVAV
jgi:hypothetical protein